MRVDALTAPSAPASSAQASSVSGGLPGLGGDTFLQLLVAQLRNQDPMNAMDNQAFIAQMAQLSTVEQLQSIDKNLQIQQQMTAVDQALGLLGRQVEYQSADGQTKQTGVVEEVKLSSGLPTLIIDGNEVLPADVLGIKP